MIADLAPAALAAWLGDRTRAQPVLLDVREDWEYLRCHLPGSLHLPVRELDQRLDELERDARYVLICHHGVRSLMVARHLARLGYGALYNLSGGIDGWAREVDPGMPRY